MVDYEKYMYKKIIKYKKTKKLSWKMALPPDESPCVHEHISPLLGEHPRIVNIFWGPVSVHYREV